MLKFFSGALCAAFIALVPQTGATQPKENHAQQLVHKYAIQMGVPVNLAMRVSRIESNHRCNVGSKYIGPLQIAYASARGLGYRGTYASLKASCDLQVFWGMRHLSAAYKSAGGNQVRAACKHQAGIRATCRKGNAYTRKVFK